MLDGTVSRLFRAPVVCKWPALLTAWLTLLAAGCGVTPTAPENLAGSSGSLSARRPAKSGPDLVADVPVFGGIESAGAEKSVAIQTTNQGNAPAGESYSRLYFSTDRVLDPSDVQIGPDIWVKALAPGERFSNNGSYGCDTAPNCNDVPVLHFFIPSERGTYYYIVEADHYGTVAESNEANNILVKKVIVR